MNNLNKDKVLVCFTASFPYGGRETYFETELKYLASEFKEVIIIPKYNPYKTDLKRNIPENVLVYTPLVPNGKVKRIFAGILNFSPVDIYVKEFFNKAVYKNSYHLYIWFISLIMFRLSYKNITKILDKYNDKDVLFYSYWAEAPLILTDYFKKFKNIVRMHRGDFYTEEHQGYLPLRDEIYKRANLLLPISEDIKNRLMDTYHIDKSNIYKTYLGTEKSFSIPEDPNDNILRIVSCSRVDAIKRVDLIAHAILAIKPDIEVEWHHFGDGNTYQSLKELIASTKPNIKIILHGWAKQEDIYNFYATNYVHWFVNVSLHEGVPVSIMEAMSFSIPVIATDVGATRELVNNFNGFIVEKEISAEKLTSLLIEFTTASYATKRENAYNTWDTTFNASKNYTLLGQKLNSL